MHRNRKGCLTRALKHDVISGPTAAPMIDANSCSPLSAVRFHFGADQRSFVRLVLGTPVSFSLPGAQSQSTRWTLHAGFPSTAPNPWQRAASSINWQNSATSMTMALLAPSPPRGGGCLSRSHSRNLKALAYDARD